eukprot:CAMPEP_0179360684 /NCGR_PEP_ID=MMETSP0797-20121207/80107_1 /TAXON_ID=47934 /ORGANISM="Dinophysis acuminata, Strain DAEP01" /LENGTH=335 /DNA_ID=CAMNT_0021076053 /DNA_START=249 /DNA_END=1254 /DNA_ORIENTATION=+
MTVSWNSTSSTDIGPVLGTAEWAAPAGAYASCANVRGASFASSAPGVGRAPPGSPTQGLAGAQPPARVPHQEPPDQVARGLGHVPRDPQVDARDPRQAHRRLAAEGGRSNEHLVEQDAHGPDIDTVPVRLVLHHLRGEVVQGAAEGVPLPAVRDLRAPPEVAELRDPVCAQQDVLGLDVAVDDVPLVEVGERERDVPEDLGGVPLRQAAALLHNREEGPAARVLQQQVEVVGVLEVAVEAEDVRVLQGDLGLYLPEEVRRHLVLLELLLRYDLHRVERGGPHVYHLPHHAPGPGPDVGADGGEVVEGEAAGGARGPANRGRCSGAFVARLARSVL